MESVSQGMAIISRVAWRRPVASFTCMSLFLGLEHCAY